MLQQLIALLKCDVRDNPTQVLHGGQTLIQLQVLDTEGETEITMRVFQLLVSDLLALFQALNQGLINILGKSTVLQRQPTFANSHQGHFFEMSRTDAERAMDIYRNFTKYTDYVVQYLSVARQYEHRTGVQVPKLTHAPVNLGRQLEEYLNDTDFDIHRRQYLAEQTAKRDGKGGKASTPFDLPKPPPSPGIRTNSAKNSNNPFPTPSQSKPSAAPPNANKGPDPDLIDFFDSIEQNQTTMQVNPQATNTLPNIPFAAQQQMGFQQNGFAPQQTGFPMNNQFQQPQQQPQQLMQQQTGMFTQPNQGQQQQLQPNFTGAGFGGFTPQPQPTGFQPGSLAPISQNTASDFQNQNFMQPQQQQQPSQLQPMQTGTNPFRQSMMPQPTGTQNNFTGFGGQQNDHNAQAQSTNPFARNVSPQGNNSPFQSQPPAPAPLQPAPTGTNPFARNLSPPAGQQQQQQQSLAPQPTGTTNPFRHGDFVNHNTGMGWQHNQSPIGGGIDQIQTMPVFPRPGQQTPWQQ